MCDCVIHVPYYTTLPHLLNQCAVIVSYTRQRNLTQCLTVLLCFLYVALSCFLCPSAEPSVVMFFVLIAVRGAWGEFPACCIDPSEIICGYFT